VVGRVYEGGPGVTHLSLPLPIARTAQAQIVITTREANKLGHIVGTEAAGGGGHD
jgi:hypothetical protein